MRLKADFHIHAKGDPRDRLIRHTVFDVIDRAKEENFDVISVTFHRRVCFSNQIKDYAESKGILFIPGVELEVNSLHVILLNPSSFDISGIKDFSDLRRFKQGANAVVVAPHAFFPGSSSLNSKFFEHQDLFDAVEVNGVYVSWLNYNKNLKKILGDIRLPIIGSSDTHFLSQFGLTYTLLEAEKNINSVLEAIRKNRVEVITRPLNVKNNGVVTIGMFVISGVLREAVVLFRRCISFFLRFVGEKK